MIVTTAGRTSKTLLTRSKSIADELNIPFVARQTDSIVDLHNKYFKDVLVVGKNRLQLYKKGNTEPFFFHPNSAMFRVKRLLKGEQDPFVEAAKLVYGGSFLDCTLGLGSDSIVASFVVGQNGTVLGLEVHKIISYMVKEGLQTWDSGLPTFNDAMRRIKVEHAEHFDFLKSLPNKSLDVIYFDPMFDEQIIASNGISELRGHAHYSKLTNSIIDEAKRVAIKRIVLKDHFRSEKFEKFGFQVFKRPSAKFHFGVMEL